MIISFLHQKTTFINKQKNTSKLTKGADWKAAGKNLAGIIIGLVAANQIQKLNPTPINANLASGGFFDTGGVLKKKGQTDLI